jgi:calcineurin-like phosphoesterase family protein
MKRGEVDYWKKFYESHGWTVLSERGETLDIPGVGVVNLNHMPYDTVDARYQDYKWPDDGRWLLCGHIHQHWKVKGRMINVGVDVWNYTPVHIDEISKIILASP